MHSPSPRFASINSTKGFNKDQKQLPTSKRAWDVICFGAYLFGSLLFLVGSAFFYPGTASLWNGHGYDFGAYCFVFGCVSFLIGTNMDFINIVWANGETEVWQRLIVTYNGMSYVVATWIFFFGAIFFLPNFYKDQPEIGCGAFIIGCGMFFLSAVVDLIQLCLVKREPLLEPEPESSETSRRQWQLSNLRSWSASVLICTIIGAVLFIVGSYFYLPKFIASTVHPEDNRWYLIRSTDCFLIGSVFFTLSALSQVPGLCQKK